MPRPLLYKLGTIIIAEQHQVVMTILRSGATVATRIWRVVVLLFQHPSTNMNRVLVSVRKAIGFHSIQEGRLIAPVQIQLGEGMSFGHAAVSHVHTFCPFLARQQKQNVQILTHVERLET